MGDFPAAAGVQQQLPNIDHFDKSTLSSLADLSREFVDNVHKTIKQEAWIIERLLEDLQSAPASHILHETPWAPSGPSWLWWILSCSWIKYTWRTTVGSGPLSTAAHRASLAANQLKLAAQARDHWVGMLRSQRAKKLGNLRDILCTNHDESNNVLDGMANFGSTQPPTLWDAVPEGIDLAELNIAT